MASLVCSTKPADSAHLARVRWLSPSAPPSEEQDDFGGGTRNTSELEGRYSLRDRGRGREGGGGESEREKEREKGCNEMK